MKINITKKIGKATLTFQVEGEKERDTLFKASGFTTIPEQCGLCKGENIVLDGNEAEGYLFIKIKCLDCGGRSQMGERKDGMAIFWKAWEKYNPEETKKDVKKGGEKK